MISFHIAFVLFYRVDIFGAKNTPRTTERFTIYTFLHMGPTGQGFVCSKTKFAGPVHQKGGTARVKFAFYTCASMCDDVLEHKRATQDAKRSLRLDGETQCTQIICMLRVSTSTTEQPYADYLHNSEAIVKTTGWFVRC